MAAAFDASGEGLSAANVNALSTESFTVAGSERFLWADIASGAGSPVGPSAAKWGGSGGTSMTQDVAPVTVHTDGRHSAYKLTAPTAQTSTGYVTWGTNQDETLIVFVSATGIDQTTPIRSTTAALSSAQNPTHNVTTVAGDLVINGTFIMDGGSEAKTLTHEGTLAEKIDGADVGGYECLAVGYKTAAGTSTSMGSAVAGKAPSTDWAHLITVVLIPSSGGGGAATRGTPFGNRSTAFNGGRTFHGVIQ